MLLGQLTETAWVLALGVMIGVCFLPLLPYQTISIEAAMSMLQCYLIHLQMDRFRVTGSGRPHPLADLQASLDALRLKASRHRTVGSPLFNQLSPQKAKGAVKIQAHFRGCIVRASMVTAMTNVAAQLPEYSERPVQSTRTVQ